MRGSPNASLRELHDVSVVLDKEAWRYSERAWNALHAQPFVAADPHTAVPAALLEQSDWAQTRGERIVFVNGDAASTSDLRLRDGQRVHLVFANVPGARSARWQREFAITLDHGSAEIVEQHVGSAGADVLGEAISRVRVGAGARLRMTTLCDLPDSVSLYRREHVAIAAGGSYSSTHVLFGGRLQRFDLNVELAGEQANYAAHGVFAPRGRQHIDVHLDARHAARDTRSEVSWRGVADQRGRGILRGAITVAAGADGADAQLQTKNLLLSPHAEIDAQPVLEIHADEVKAAHGATVGQLDERALFYLRSRGLPLGVARNLLIAGFCREAFTRMDDAQLRALLESLLAKHLPQAQENLE
jgi:Fe-S cluster assembly protein SufD